MAKWRCTFLLDAPKAGWSETLFIEKSTMREAIQPCKNFAAIRVAGIGRYGKVEAVRISSVEPPSISIVEMLNYKSPHTGSTHLADTPWQGIQIRYSDVNEKYQTTRIWRAPPDPWIARRPEEGDYDLVGTGEVLDWSKSLASSLRANVFLFKDRSAEGAAGVNTTVLGFGTSAVGGLITFTTALPMPVGTRLTFDKVKDSTGRRVLKGSYTVKEVAGNLVTLHQSVPTGENPGDWIPTTYRVKESGYFPFWGSQLQRPSSRDTGRPFFLRRGRQPKQKK